MARKYFGTDGVRGTVGSSPMTPDFVLRLGYAAGKVLSGKGARASGGADRQGHAHLGLHARVGARGGLLGRRRRRAHVRPDAHARRRLPHARAAPVGRRGDQRLAQSLSDNGIKFFSGDGFKLPDDTEARIEARDRAADGLQRGRQARQGLARGRCAGGRYIEFCKSTFPAQLDLKGLRLVVDCAHGAAYNVAPHVFHELGADVVPIGVDPTASTSTTASARLRPSAA